MSSKRHISHTSLGPTMRFPHGERTSDGPGRDRTCDLGIKSPRGTAATDCSQVETACNDHESTLKQTARSGRPWRQARTPIRTRVCRPTRQLKRDRPHCWKLGPVASTGTSSRGCEPPANCLVFPNRANRGIKRRTSLLIGATRVLRRPPRCGWVHGLHVPDQTKNGPRRRRTTVMLGA